MRPARTRVRRGVRLLEGSSQAPAAAHVLVADDDAAIREFIAVHLRAAGFEVLTAADGRQALAKVAVVKPDVVTLDAGMPGLTGLQVASILRSDPATSSIRTVLLWPARAGHDQLDDSAGVVDASLTKPFDPGELVALVRGLTGSR